MGDFTPIIHRHKGVDPFFVNAFMVETANSVVVIDSLIAISDVKSVRDMIDNQIKKKLAAVLLTHGHPDHYTGAAEMIAGYGDVPVMATQAVIEQCKSRDEEESGYLGSDEAFGAEYPRNRMFPNVVVNGGETHTFDDVSFVCEDLGPCESDDDLTWTIRVGGFDHVFAGDIVYNHAHTFFRDGHFTHWLEQLDYCLGKYDHTTVFHTGHGEDFGIEMLQWQKGYNLAFRDLLKSMLGDRETLTQEEQQALLGRMMQVLPNDKLIFLTGWQFDDMVKALRADGAL